MSKIHSIACAAEAVACGQDLDEGCFCGAVENKISSDSTLLTRFSCGCIFDEEIRMFVTKCTDDPDREPVHAGGSRTPCVRDKWSRDESEVGHLPERKSDLWHFINNSFKVVCGANVPDQSSTRVRSHVTCEACNGVLREAETAPLTLPINTYEVVRRAVEEGIRYGWSQAHKHTDAPADGAVKEEIESQVMNALSEVVAWER